MVAFVDEHRSVLGVEPMCKELQIVPSTYYRLKSLENAPEKFSPRRQQDELYKSQIRRVWEENHEVYGARKIWRQLHREGFEIARYTTERLMRAMGLKGRHAWESDTTRHDYLLEQRFQAHGSRPAGIPCGAAKPTLGGRFHLWCDVERLCLCCVHFRRLLPHDRRLASHEGNDHCYYTGCA